MSEDEIGEASVAGELELSMDPGEEYEALVEVVHTVLEKHMKTRMETEFLSRFMVLYWAAKSMC